MNTEYERKFILKEYPSNFTDFNLSKIKQWYISKPGDLISIRIRLYDDNRCYMDLKKGFGIERYEYGLKCSYDDIKGILNEVPFIEKDRYKLHTDNYLLIIDVFDNGLKLVEIESNNFDIVKDFKPFDWIGEEVTNKIEYTNNYLAYKNFNPNTMLLF